MKIKMQVFVALSILMTGIYPVNSQEHDACILKALAKSSSKANSLNEGMKLYNAGKYQQALAQLTAAVKQNPAEPLAHYYLGNCYYALKQVGKAKSEYQQVTLLAPYSQSAQYAQMALDNLSGKSASHVSHSSGVSAPADSDSVISRMKSQAEEATRRNGDIYKDLSGRANSQIEERIKQLKAEEEDRIKAVPETILGGRPNPEHQSTVDNIKAEIKTKIEELTKNRDRQKSTYDKATNQRSNSYDSMVDNLKTQMDGGGRSGVRLKPEGTNIYIRNYGQ